jgi:ABC-type sugar transport system permease subunit
MTDNSANHMVSALTKVRQENSKLRKMVEAISWRLWMLTPATLVICGALFLAMVAASFSYYEVSKYEAQDRALFALCTGKFTRQHEVNKACRDASDRGVLRSGSDPSAVVTIVVKGFIDAVVARLLNPLAKCFDSHPWTTTVVLCALVFSVAFGSAFALFASVLNFVASSLYRPPPPNQLRIQTPETTPVRRKLDYSGVEEEE